MKIDIHTHTSRYSGCSRIGPEELVEEAAAAGLDAVVVTEHHIAWDPKDLSFLSSMAVRVFGGVEITTTDGDCLVLAPELEGLSTQGTIEELAVEVHERDGLLLMAHPFRTTLMRNRRYLEADIDGLEVQSCNCFGRFEREAAEDTARAGELMCVTASDAHSRDMVGCFCMEFDRPVQDVPGLIGALRRGGYGRQRNDERFYAYFDARSARFRALVTSEVLAGCRDMESLKRSTGLSSDVIRSVLADTAGARSA